MLLAACIAVGIGETVLAGESDLTWLALALLPLIWIIGHATVVGRSSAQHAMVATAAVAFLAAIGAVKADDPAVLIALAVTAGMAAAVLWGRPAGNIGRTPPTLRASGPINKIRRHP